MMCYEFNANDDYFLGPAARFLFVSLCDLGEPALCSTPRRPPRPQSRMRHSQCSAQKAGSSHGEPEGPSDFSSADLRVALVPFIRNGQSLDDF